MKENRYASGPSMYQCVCVRSVTSVVSRPLRPCDCSPPGSSVHRILQARILERVAMHSQGIFLTQRLNLRLLHLLHCRQILYH